MAKSVRERFQESLRQTDRPTQSPPADKGQSDDGQCMATAVEFEGVSRITVELPIAVDREQNANCGPIHLDGVDLTRDQSNKLRRIASALDKAGAICETRSGRRRATHWRHAIRYILDQVEA